MGEEENKDGTKAPDAKDLGMGHSTAGIQPHKKGWVGATYPLHVPWNHSLWGGPQAHLGPIYTTTLLGENEEISLHFSLLFTPKWWKCQAKRRLLKMETSKTSVFFV